MARKTKTSEEFVLPYLQYLEDPSSLLDETTIARAQTAVDRAKDPIGRIKALTALERAQTVDEGALRAAFVDHAARWCEEADVTPSALATYGVPGDVLVEAGLAQPVSRKRRPATTTPVPGRRAPKLGLDQVLDAAPTGDFTVHDLAAAIDREVGTARNYLTRLVEAGLLVVVERDGSWTGRGKPPTVYRRS
jgi:hypothetical protein